MELSINFLKKIALNVFDAIHPILGSEKSAEKAQRGAGGDISMKIDIIAEQIVIKTLESENIDILLISEEIGEKYIGNEKKAIQNQSILIVDPIDGSNNAVRGIPYCSISIAYAKSKSMKGIEKAVVLNLISKDIYWAVKGKSAYKNEKIIQVSNLDFSDKCFLEIDFPKKNAFKTIEQLKPIIQNFYRMRIMGSSALTLCQVACGSMEAFINLRKSNRLVDVAAGYLILKEAGGSFFSLQGTDINKELSINARFPFIACNAKLESFLKEDIIFFSQEH